MLLGRWGGEAKNGRRSEFREIAKDRRHGLGVGAATVTRSHSAQSAERPHGSDADCIAALNEEIALHQGSGSAMTRAKTARRDLNGGAGAVAERQSPDKPIFRRTEVISAAACATRCNGSRETRLRTASTCPDVESLPDSPRSAWRAELTAKLTAKRTAGGGAGGMRRPQPTSPQQSTKRRPAGTTVNKACHRPLETSWRAHGKERAHNRA
jgi:hypothetical protein